MIANTQGRRPDGPGAYHYEDDSNLMDCLVHYNQEGTRLQALWVGNDLFLPGYPTDKWRFIDDMPGDFVPLHPPVAAPEPDWSQAPEWATAHVFDGSGTGMYLDHGWDYGGSPMLDGVVSWDWDGSRFDDSGLTLPLGLDWRTTLRKRPEVGDE